MHLLVPSRFLKSQYSKLPSEWLWIFLNFDNFISAHTPRENIPAKMFFVVSVAPRDSYYYTIVVNSRFWQKMSYRLTCWCGTDLTVLRLGFYSTKFQIQRKWNQSGHKIYIIRYITRLSLEWNAKSNYLTPPNLLPHAGLPEIILHCSRFVSRD